MKKILAVLLSVMMLFGALSFNSSATTYDNISGSDSLILTLRNTGVINPNQVIFCFELQHGTMLEEMPVYNRDTKLFTYTAGVTGRYYLIPDNSKAYEGVAASTLHTAGTSIYLPSVVPPSGKVFDGWEYKDPKTQERRILSADSRFMVPYATYSTNPELAIIYFEAIYSPGEVEGDFLSKIISVLVSLLSDFLKPYGINIEELIGGIL